MNSRITKQNKLARYITFTVELTIPGKLNWNTDIKLHLHAWDCPYLPLLHCIELMADEDPSRDTVHRQWACTSYEYLGYRICVSRGSENRSTVCGVEAFGSYVNSSDVVSAQGESQHCAECSSNPGEASLPLYCDNKEFRSYRAVSFL